MKTPLYRHPLRTLLLLGVLAGCVPILAERVDPPSSGRLLTIEELEMRAEEAARQDALARAREESELRAREAEIAALAEALAMEPVEIAEPVGITEPVDPISTPSPAPVVSGIDPSADLREALERERQGNVANPNFIAPDQLTVSTPPRVPLPAQGGITPARRRINPQTDNPRRITVSFLDTPIEDVVGVFASWSGRSILMGDGVRGRTITADINSQPWHIALETILRTNSMEPSDDPETGIISIRGQAEARLAEEQARPSPEIFKINYAMASDIAPRLSEIFGDRIRVTEVTHLNSLMVSAAPETLLEVESLIGRFDRRPATVGIQAQIISIARSEMERMGFRYNLVDPRQDYTAPDGGMSSITGIPQVEVQTMGARPPMLLNRSNNATFEVMLQRAMTGTPYTLSAFVDALQGVSLAEVHARPVINVLSDKSATIEVGDAFHVPTLVNAANMGGVQGGGGGSTGSGSNSSGVSSGTSGGGREQIRVGISLDVTPRVTNNGKIWLDISAKRSGGEIGPDGTITESFQSGITEMIVDDGETVVIGGLTLSEATEGHVGVPLLKDLPVVGSFFRHRSRVQGERDLIILVTPTVLYHPDSDDSR